MLGKGLARPATVVIAGALVWVLRKTPGQVIAVITHSGASAPGFKLRGMAGLDELAALTARGLLWSLAAWALLGMAAAAIARLPGTVGWVGRALLTVVVPRAVRGSLLGALSAGLAFGPVVSAGATSGPSRPSTPSVPAGPSTVGPAVPTSGPAVAQTDPAIPAAALPAPRWPASLIAAQPSRPPASQPATTAQPGNGAATGPAGQPTKTVTVAPGDSLWLIAGRWVSPPGDLAATDAAWPKWYAANRAAIGADPNLIRPGQVLRAPSEAPGRAQ